MADLLDELTVVAKTDRTQVVDELHPDRPIMECPYVCCMRLDTVRIDHPDNIIIMEKLQQAMRAFRGVELLTDIEIGCRDEYQKCGSVPGHMFTDASVYLCFGADIHFRNVDALKRLLKIIVRASWRDVLHGHSFSGLLIHQKGSNRWYTEQFYYVTGDILGTTRRITTYDADIDCQYRRLCIRPAIDELNQQFVV